MITGHLFAGAGGGLYADLILGHRPVIAVEWERYPAGILEQRAAEGWFPGLHVHHGDIGLFDPSPWAGRLDSLHAGFPCQDISVAGMGRGIEGERSGLWSEVVRCADAIRPGELFLENSPAIVGRGLDRVLSDLAALGFDAEWCCIPAAGVCAPHRRDRWWCLARRSDADGSGRGQTQHGKQCREQGKEPCENGCAMADADLQRLDGSAEKHGPHRREEFTRDCCQMADAMREGSQGITEKDKTGKNRIKSRGATGCSGWWKTEPGLGRVVDGLADRVNRIKALGNGQVPLQAAMAYILLSRRFDAAKLRQAYTSA